ncbi:hypothetical protein LPJ72_003500 [Coemansia sp. Benny D160-2]|nr:hypothetical protein LPJ72_003500 [Coemansia sp. Benny D160-2]
MYTVDTLERLCVLENEILVHQIDTYRRRQHVEETLRKARKAHELKRALAAMRMRVEAKKRMVEQRALLVEAASGVVEIYMRKRDPKCTASVETATQELVATRKRVRQARIIVEDLRAMLARERAQCAEALQQVYPMELGGEGGAWTICGEELFAADDISTRIAGEQTAMALGLVACAVDAAATYLCAPIRFPVIVRGARSAVVNPASQTLWPLFIGRAADRGRLRTAQRMLSTNVVQLLARLGVDDADSRMIIGNLAQLLMVIESASFA